MNSLPIDIVQKALLLRVHPSAPLVRQYFLDLNVIVLDSSDSDSESEVDFDYSSDEHVGGNDDGDSYNSEAYEYEGNWTF
jgi:hypothetical protein